MVGAAIVGALIVLGLALIAWFLLAGDEDDVTQDSVSFTVPDGPAVPVPAERITVTASSFLAPDAEAGISYTPLNLLDGDLTTAWNSETDDDQGRGETLTFRFSEPVDLKGIRFVNGYTKSGTVYAANHRVRELVVRTDGLVQPITLMDIMEEQEAEFAFGLTSKVEIEIVEIYQGDGFLDDSLTTDLALSELTFIAVQR